MHIQLQHSFFSPIRSGQERRVHALVKELLSRGHRVSILVSKDGIDSVERYQKQGIDCIVHPTFFSDGWRALFNPYLYTRRLKTFLAPVYSRDRPDLVLSFNIFYVAATKRVCPELPVGYLTGGTIRDWHSQLYRDRPWFKRPLLRMMTGLAQRIESEALTKAEAVFVEVTATQRRLEEDNPKAVGVRYINWPTPVDKDRFKPNSVWRREIRKELGVTDNQVLLLCVGRFQWNKNFGLVIKALGKIGSRDFQLVLVGEGPERRTFQELAASQGLSDKVKFVGSRQDVERVYAAADIFLHPALVEVFGNVVQEAMASGLACIASPGKYVGFSEYLTDGVDAFLADPHDLLAWIEKLEQLMNDKELRRRLGSSARGLIEARPDLAQLTDVILRELDHAR